MKYIVNGQHMRPFSKTKKMADQSIEFVTVEFEFSKEWAKLAKVAQFTQGKTYNVALENDQCKLPHELSTGPVLISVFGYDYHGIRATVIPVSEVIEQSGFVSDGQDSIPPTPDLYAQLVGKIDQSLEHAVPIIKDGNWWMWSAQENDYIDSGFPAVGSGGNTPTDVDTKIKEHNESESSHTDIRQMVQQKLDSTELPEAINAALAQAKASGEFKGDKGDPGTPGKDGQNGKDGPPGADGQNGKTPVKGVDYFTPEDTEQIAQAATEKLGFDKQYVDEQIATRQARDFVVTELNIRGDADHSSEEVFNAFNEGKRVYLLDFTKKIVELLDSTAEEAKFARFTISPNNVSGTISTLRGKNITTEFKKYTPSAATVTATVPSGITADGNVQSVLDALATRPSGGDIGLGVTNATVGQFIKVKAVDAQGKPTDWEPADAPSGGGGEGWIELLNKAVTVSTPVTSLTENLANGNDYGEYELFLHFTSKGTAPNGRCKLALNKVGVAGGDFPYSKFFYSRIHAGGIFFSDNWAANNDPRYNTSMLKTTLLGYSEGLSGQVKITFPGEFTGDVELNIYGKGVQNV